MCFKDRNRTCRAMPMLFNGHSTDYSALPCAPDAPPPTCLPYKHAAQARQHCNGLSAYSYDMWERALKNVRGRSNCTTAMCSFVYVTKCKQGSNVRRMFWLQRSLKTLESQTKKWLKMSTCGTESLPSRSQILSRLMPRSCVHAKDRVWQVSHKSSSTPVAAWHDYVYHSLRNKMTYNSHNTFAPARRRGIERNLLRFKSLVTALHISSSKTCTGVTNKKVGVCFGSVSWNVASAVVKY